jgi:hypothetical protein
MLLATTIMLLVFRLPSATVSVMWLISAKMFIHEKPPFPLRKFHSIANLCATLNAATTFIMFIIYGTKFRSEFTRIYGCILRLIKKTKRTTTIRREQQLPLPQMKSLIANDNNTQENEQLMNETKNKINLTIIYQSNGKDLSRTNSSAAATTASNVSPSPMRHSKLQRRREYDLMNNDNNNNNTDHEQHEIVIREEESNDEHNHPKSVSFTDSYFGWFKNWIDCHY